METIENGVDMLVLLNSLSKMLRHGIAAFTLSVGVVGLASAQVMPPADLDFDGENCANLYGMRTFNLADWAFSLPSDVPQNYFSEVLQAQYDHTVSPVCNQLVDTMLNTDEGRIGSSDNDRSLIWGANGHVGDFTISSISGAQFDLVKLDLGLLLGSSQSFSVAGYKDGTLVTVIETVSYSDVSDSLGEVMFTSVTTDNVSQVSGSFATLIFGDAYNSIDELRINSPFAALEIDNIDVSVPPPSVTTLSPISGPLAGGNSVTIIGTEFSTATAVSFGGTAANSFTVNNATEITATAPAGSAGAVNVEVTTAGGIATATGAYTYLSAPTIVSLTPTSGATAGGTSVVITGANFNSATAVSFGGTAVSSFSVDSATQITATVPAGSAGSVNVAVTTAGGTATATGAYTYVSSDATLSSLLLSHGALSPAFSSGTTSYIASVSNAVSALTVTPTVTEGTATITVNGVAVSSGSASGTITLNVGSNTITTIVTAGDSTTTQTYTTTVTRAAASQTITFNNPGDQNFGTTPTLTATATSGLTVSFSSSTTGVCTITSGGALTFVSTGTCTIDADQAGDSSYLAATTVSQSFAVDAVVSGSPTIGTATAGDGQASVTFTAPTSTGGAAITGYTVTSSPGGFTGTGSSSPITVTGLTNGTAYTFTVTATNSAGTSAASAASNAVTPVTSQTISFNNPGAQNFGATPTLTATANSGLTVSFTSQTTGVCTITSGGALTFVSAGTCTIDADQAGDSSYLAATTVTQSFSVNAVVPSSPTIGTATAGDGQASVTFTAPASTGGAAITGYTVISSPGGFTGTGSSSPITVTGLTNSTAYTFTVTATNSAGTSAASAASNAVTPVTSQTPATEFAEHEAEISNVITSDAGRSLSGTISSNRSTVQAARERFIAGRSPEAMDLETVPFDVDGGFESNPTSISSKGTFFGQTVTNTGHRRFMFGDFDIQHDSETGSNTATMNGKVAWERSVSEKTLLGYVIGGELVRSNIMGSFEGEQNRLGLSVGGYAVHEIARKVYLDGFFSLGAGRNNLTMTNDVLTLDSEYTTGTITFGAALSGVVEQQGFEIWPELSLNYGKTWLGHINFIGSAHGTTDTTLSLEAGTIAMSNVVFRPQIRVPVGDSLAKNYITFAPRLTCEYIRTDVTQQNCGTGVELTYSSVTADGQSNLSAKIMSDSIGSRKNSAIQINLQHRF